MKMTNQKLINQISSFDFVDIQIDGSGYEQTSANKEVRSSNQLTSFSLHYVSSGRGYLRINDKEIPVTARQIFLLTPHSSVQYYPHKKNPWKYCWINFSGTKSQQLIEMLPFSLENPVISSPTKKLEKLFLNNVIECEATPFLSHILALRNFYDIIIELTIPFMDNPKNSLNNFPSLIDNATFNTIPKSIQNAVSYIYANYQNPHLRLSFVASYIQLSESYLAKNLKKYTGLSFSDFLLKTRLLKSLELLNNTTLSIKEISYLVGFNDPYYFSNVFKKHQKISPSEHRKQHR